MADGEWWRVDGPWRVLGRKPEGAAVEGAAAEPVESVYAPEVPVTQPETPPEGAWLIARAAPSGPLTAADFPGWDSIVFEFPVAEPEPAVLELPEQRTDEPEAVEQVPAGPGRTFLTGRRPSALVLLAVAVLLGGAVTGQLLALLAGWGLAYVAPRLGDLTRKFAVLVVPLGTVTATAVWQWGRAQGRWGSPAGPADQLGQQVWDGAPGALRLAAVLSSVFLLVVTLRRRKAVAEV
ncbi:hypothetical protein [Kitasatospora sp. NPDC002040]|uniref:hypothetical protein n=1 Tax=Kitasatospora sp. NPDC002040 TaxID=3154661 RepID=UPI00332BA97D